MKKKFKKKNICLCLHLSQRQRGGQPYIFFFCLTTLSLVGDSGGGSSFFAVLVGGASPALDGVGAFPFLLDLSDDVPGLFLDIGGNGAGSLVDAAASGDRGACGAFRLLFLCVLLLCDIPETVLLKPPLTLY